MQRYIAALRSDAQASSEHIIWNIIEDVRSASSTIVGRDIKSSDKLCLYADYLDIHRPIHRKLTNIDDRPKLYIQF